MGVVVLVITGLTWALTIGLIVVLLALDLALAAARPHVVGFREATLWSVFYVAVAVAFGVWFAIAYGGDAGTQDVDGKIVTRVDGRRMVTPLFIVLIAVGSIDLLFALDSIPAVFGVTSEPYIVFVANAFALLGLRALFFLVKGLLDRLVYLSTGLAIILAFIGVKLVLHWAHVDINPAVPEIPTPVSLGLIIAILVVVTVASLVKTRKDPTLKAHA